MQTDVGEVRRLLAKGTNYDCQDSTGRSPLHRAVQNNDKFCAEELIKMDCDVDAQDHKGATPLHVAAGRPAGEDVLRILLVSGANLHATDTANGWTPLHYAALRGNHSAVPLLLESMEGAVSISSLDKTNSNPLHWGAVYGHISFLVRLLKHANQQVLPHALIEKNAQGKTPSDLAKAYRHHNVARLLDSWKPPAPEKRVVVGRSQAAAAPTSMPTTSDDDEVNELKSKLGIGTASMMIAALVRAKKQAQLNVAAPSDSRIARQASMAMRRQEKTAPLPRTPLQRRAMSNVVSFDGEGGDAPCTVHQLAVR